MFKQGEKITAVKYGGGASYQDLKLVVDNNQLLIKATLRGLLLEAIFQFSVWFGFIFIFFDALILSDKSMLNAAVVFFCICLTMSWVTHYFLAKSRVVKVFDLTKQFFYVGARNKGIIKFSDIAGLHLITNRIYNSDKTYTCHELSFYTHNGQRTVLSNHADRDSTMLLAQKLVDILGIEIETLEAQAIYESN